MITDARPLQPEFVLGDVRHRDGEVDALTAGLEPLLDGNHAEPALLYGPSGTGKTCIARYAVERLRDARDDPYVLVLDEVDQLEEMDVLYDLNRTSGLSLVLIANSEEDVFRQLGQRVTSRVKTATRIHFDRYSPDELVAILGDRVRWGLHEGAATDDQLRRIAEAAGGDARVAISSLRVAAQKAKAEGLEQLTDEVIAEATPEAKAEIRRRNLQKLSDDQRILYDVVSEYEEIRPDELYEAYCERVDDPRTRRTVRSYLQKMRRYNLVEARGRGKARRYRPLN